MARITTILGVSFEPLVRPGGKVTATRTGEGAEGDAVTAASRARNWACADWSSCRKAAISNADHPVPITISVVITETAKASAGRLRKMFSTERQNEGWRFPSEASTTRRSERLNSSLRFLSGAARKR